MDQRIADYIRDHRGTYTREALTQQLIDAGYTREAIDATWAALDTPDPDDTAGEGFWGRFFLRAHRHQRGGPRPGRPRDGLVLVTRAPRAPGHPGSRAGDRRADRMGPRRARRSSEDGSNHGDGHRLRDPARLLAAHRWQLLRAADRPRPAAAERHAGAGGRCGARAEPDRNREVHPSIPTERSASSASCPARRT